ncbi:MAG TPA: CRISPR-associated endoribonuclease Cas6 [Balneolales bacterium]|nr:CRISPR-associated endoribonuclease Cas6 [Balneolales bacterium]
MRVKLILGITDTSRNLPINYQYEFSAWIYKTLHYGDPTFARWLHDHGYTEGKRSFKLFSFSNLDVDRFKINGDRFQIVSDEARLILTFHIDEAIQHFVTGLFRHNAFTIGDRKSQVDFEVKSVEMLHPPEFTDTMRFRTLSPVCISRPVENNGKLTAEYLAPGHPEYSRRFFENLLTRYRSSQQQYQQLSKSFELLESSDNPKSRLIKIKADTPQETRVRGYLYDFECSAPAELLRFGYEAGFGEKNSLGFGCVEVIKLLESSKLSKS